LLANNAGSTCFSDSRWTTEQNCSGVYVCHIVPALSAPERNLLFVASENYFVPVFEPFI
jgi:hypothetical protein